MKRLLVLGMGFERGGIVTTFKAMLPAFPFGILAICVANSVAIVLFFVANSLVLRKALPR